MGIRPEVQTHDGADNFKPPGTPLTLSPALTSFLNGLNLTPKGYDDNHINKVFADTFRLRSCKVCFATLEVRIRHDQDIWTNDTLTVGNAPFNTSPGVNIFYTSLWSPPGTNPKSPTFVLPAAALNNYIGSLMGGSAQPWLDVIAQDDTDFDYAKLSVWYY